MERFFSQDNIERYRKLFDMSTDEPQRRLMFELLAVQAHTMQMGVNSELIVRFRTARVTNTPGSFAVMAIFNPVKFSAPVFLSENAARASGNEVRTLYLARLAAETPKVKRPRIPPPQVSG